MKSKKSTDGKKDAEKSPRPLGIGDLATQSIDLADLLTRDVSSSGSFDIRGGIWATTFGKLMQVLPIPAMLVDQSFKVVAANQAWGRVSPAYETVLNIHFSELFAPPRNARKIQSVIEEVFSTRRAKVVEASIRLGETMEIWGRITLRSIRIIQERFLLVLVENLTAERKQLALNEIHREELEVARQDLEKKVNERTAQLSRTNKILQNEIEEHRKSEEQLKIVVREIEQQLRELRNDMLLKMRTSLQPLIDQLKAEASASEACSLLIRAMDYHLSNTFSSLAVWADPRLVLLTPREIQVCNLIASGLTSKQVASVMHVSPDAISSQRVNIKKKLNLDSSRESIGTWLSLLYGYQADRP